MSLRTFLAEATSDEAQLALSYLVWPDEAPDPCVLDEWLRCHVRQDPGTAPGQHGVLISGDTGTPDPWIQAKSA